MADANNILKYLETNKTRLLSEYHLTKIGLFGSMARGEQTDSSDIDLVVDFEPGTPDLYSLKLKLKEEIRSRFNRSVDICRYKYIKESFRDTINSEIRYV